MSLKFKENDRFYTKNENDPNREKKGTIKKVSFNSIYQDWEYVVTWDHMNGEFSYESVEAERYWNKSNEISQSTVYSELSNKCTHKWRTYVGFTDSFDYCEKCGNKK